MIKTGLLVVILAGVLSGCTSTATDRQVLTVRLQGENQNASAMVQASLIGRGDITDITYLIGGIPVGVSRPIQLYTFIYSGTCEQLSAEPVYAMNDATQVTPTATGWSLSKAVPIALGHLNSSPHALIVRSSPADGGITLFCGDIRRK